MTLWGWAVDHPISAGVILTPVAFVLGYIDHFLRR